MGHPYYELIDNSTDFQVKMRRLCRFVHDHTIVILLLVMCRSVTMRLNIPQTGDLTDFVKRKFLVDSQQSLEPSEDNPWPRFMDFQVTLLLLLAFSPDLLIS